jgi:murein DD-endopeptidase MepM/ murein hydrolase activator NlpD
MKLLVLSSDPNLLNWKTLPKKKAAILAALNKTPGATWEVEFLHQDLQPEVVNHRITHSWYNSVSYPLFREGYHYVYLHFTPKQWKDLDLDQGLRGANQIDTDVVGESYGHSAETSLREGLNKFIQNILHEMSHQLARDTGSPDITHAWHEANPDISSVFAFYPMTKWHPRYVELLKQQKSLAEQLLGLLQPKYLRPLPDHWNKVTQPWGNYDRHTYPKSGVHAGTDFAAPMWTAILAPADGIVTRTGYTDQLGFWLEYKMGSLYLVALHLKREHTKGPVKAGKVIGYVGDSGKIQGIHAHLEWWKVPMDRSLLTSAEAVAKYTEDITTIIK